MPSRPWFALLDPYHLVDLSIGATRSSDYRPIRASCLHTMLPQSPLSVNTRIALGRPAYARTVGANTAWHGFCVALWIAFLILLLLTAYLWYQDRRPTPGHCRKGGYDPTGNESGRCPKCGAPVTVWQRKTSGP